ncbi:MAG TPA: hypothetical protein ENH01_05975 [Nitrospirae bacterium]|nr:hypothetical protein [Nitrospirota bacterium]
MNNRKAKILLKLATLDTDKTNRYLSNYIGNLLVEIQKSKNNDQKYEKLELLKQIIYQAPSKALRIIKEIINTKNPLKPKKQTIHGLTVSGKSHDDLIVKCIELLDKIRYLKTKEGFHLLIKLSDHPNDNIQFKAVEVLKNLCQYNLFILDKIGYFAQTCVLAEIKKWNNKKILTHANVLIEISNQFLRPSFKGHSMTDYKTFTLRHGPLVVNEELINIRKDTITILKKIFTLTSDLTLQKNILQVLNESTRTPARGEYKDDMKQMILTNTNELIDFYINILPGLEYEVISAIEEQSHWFTRKFGDKDIPQVRKLKKLIATNSDYQVFRVFVGYDRDYLEERDWKKAEKLRREKIQEYITDISSKNFKEWQKRILSVIKNYSSGQLGGYQYFSNIFLRGLGKKKPSIAFKLIQQNEKELEPFLLPLIAGIWKSRSSEIAKALVTKWIDSDKHLTICAALFDYVEEIDKRLLDSCFRKSKKNGDVNALNNIVDSIITNYPKHKNLKSLFMQSIKELTRNNNTYWVNNIWYRPESILNSLTEKDYDVILENLILITRVDYHVETVLVPVAARYPKKVINFFSKRVAEQTKRMNDFSYDAIPFDLHKINEPLQKHVKVVINEIIKWYSQKTGRFEWEASHLIQAIFPTFNKEVEKELIRLIKSKKEKNAKIVLSILRAYKGEPFLHNVCKNFVRHSPYMEKFKGSLFNALSQTGVVSGEYGFMNAYKQKLEEVQLWKKDRSKAIKAFIKEYEVYLNKQIAFEQKRADEDIELRKREYGVPEE